MDLPEKPIELTGHYWLRQTGIRVRGAFPNVPMSRDEFIQAVHMHEITRYPRPLFDERPDPDQIFVDRLVEALKSEFGPEFGLGLDGSDDSWHRMARGIAKKMGVESCIASNRDIRHIRMNGNVRN